MVVIGCHALLDQYFNSPVRLLTQIVFFVGLLGATSATIIGGLAAPAKVVNPARLLTTPI
jgi:hypothetical protein